jgi:cupin 2 domain-containing protein
MNNIFAGIPQRLSEEQFDVLLERGRVRIERIVSRGHSSPETGWYDQEQNEWVVVLRGAASVAFEDGRSISLKEGDFLDIPAHSRHRVDWTDPKAATVWLAVHY